VAKTYDKGPVIRLSLLFWLLTTLVVTVGYTSLSGASEDNRELAVPTAAVAPFPSALPGSSAAIVPAPQSMAEAARVDGNQLPAAQPATQTVEPVQASQTTEGSQTGGSSAQTSVQASTSGGQPGTPTPLVVPLELQGTGQGPIAAQQPEVWLVIVTTSPKSKRELVEQEQRSYKRRGVNLDILDTDAYPRLKSGMWSLALGPFDSKADAEAAALRIQPNVKETRVLRGL
jgi:hypothetical protein